MNLTTANRLQQLRKANGYSQEVLAEKLGVSRQSVSKWERGESSPETDNLIAISRIYGITVDDLLSTDIEFEAAESEKTEHDYFAKLKSLFSKANDFGIYPNTAKRLTKFPFATFIIALYFTLSVIFNMWHPFWIIFMTIPIYYRFILACKAHNRGVFALLLPVPEIVVTLYLLSGILFGIWKYAAIMFLLIPFYFRLVPSIKHRHKALSKNQTKKESSQKQVYAAVLLTVLILISGITAVSYFCRYDNDTKNFAKITVGEARSIALEDAETEEKNVAFTKQKREREQGLYAYEIEFNDGITEYEYEIDAESGEIISRYSKRIARTNPN